MSLPYGCALKKIVFKIVLFFLYVGAQTHNGKYPQFCLHKAKTTELLPEHQAVPEGHFFLAILAYPETKL